MPKILKNDEVCKVTSKNCHLEVDDDLRGKKY